MRFEKCSTLMTRLHVESRLKTLSLSAAKIQATYRAHAVREAYLEIRTKTIKIQRWLRSRYNKKTWISAPTESRHNSYNTAATFIQKFARGYLACKVLRSKMIHDTLNVNLRLMDEFCQQKRLKIKQDLQVGLAYLFRRMIKKKKQKANEENLKS